MTTDMKSTKTSIATRRRLVDPGSGQLTVDWTLDSAINHQRNILAIICKCFLGRYEDGVRPSVCLSVTNEHCANTVIAMSHETLLTNWWAFLFKKKSNSSVTHRAECRSDQ